VSLRKVTLLTRVGHEPENVAGAQLEVDEAQAASLVSRKLAVDGWVTPTVAQYATAPGYNPLDFDEKHQANAAAGNLRATDNSDNKAARGKDEQPSPADKTAGKDEHPGALIPGKSNR
jgi:hypothetical protein